MFARLAARWHSGGADIPQEFHQISPNLADSHRRARESLLCDLIPRRQSDSDMRYFCALIHTCVRVSGGRRAEGQDDLLIKRIKQMT